METKVCIKCLQNKELSSVCFQISKKHKDGFTNVCKHCINKRSKEYNKVYTRTIITPKIKHCTKCNTKKDNHLFHKNPRRKDGLSVYCGSCMNNIKKTDVWREREKERSCERRQTTQNKQYREQYYQKNKEKIDNQKNICRLNNLEKYQETAREYHKKKMESNDILYKLRKNLRRRINLIVKNKIISTNEIIGCNWDILKNHLENLFFDGMSWENYGPKGWHIDHVIPLASAKTIDEVYQLNHFTNLQPLWAKDNLSKGAKIINK
jgi:hypothetical protein